MKLNNRGWGLKEMLILSAILIFFFGLAIYFIYVLYSSLAIEVKGDNEYVDTLIYESLEDSMEEAGISYLKKNYVLNGSKVDLDVLTAGDYLSPIVDPDTENECAGYLVVVNNNSSVVKAYIKCDNYTTSGYEE